MRDSQPTETPADRFDRWVRETEPTLPARYRHPGRQRMARPLDPFRVAPLGIAIVLAGSVIAWVFGLSRG